MADGRDIKCWNDHASDCEKEGREPFKFDYTPPLPTDPVGYPHIRKDKTNFLRDHLINADGVIRVLDLGCGPCYWINLFEGFEYHAFDQSEGMLEVAKKTLKKAGLFEKCKDFRLGNARKLGDSYPEGYFDLIFTSAVLQHNRHEPDKREIVEGMHKIIRPGGYYLCTENTFRQDNAPQWFNDHGTADGNSFTAKGWENWMKDHGFELIDFSGESEYIYRRMD